MSLARRCSHVWPQLRRRLFQLRRTCASGEVRDIKTAIDARRARLEHLDGQIKAAGVASTFDLEAFAEKAAPVILDWQRQLTKNTSTAQQALRKLLPQKIVATRNPDGSWTFKAAPDFSALLREVGVTGDAISAILQEVKLTRTRARRAPRRAR